jgi:hypothetical protein
MPALDPSSGMSADGGLHLAIDPADDGAEAVDLVE